MYQYSRAIYRSIKDLIDPYASKATQLEYRRSVLLECEHTMARLAEDPHYFARPDRALFADIRRYFPITAQAQVAWSVREARRCDYLHEQQAAQASTGIACCHATTCKGKARERTPLPGRTARHTSISSAPPRCRARAACWFRSAPTNRR
jgi:hypothetical protein